MQPDESVEDVLEQIALDAPPNRHGPTPGSVESKKTQG